MKITLADKSIAWLALLSGLSISAVAVYYSVAGLVSIFSAAVIPIIVMGVALEVSKLIATLWLKLNWNRAPIFIRTYLIVAIAILMLITSMGIFGFLSKAHSDQSLVSGDVQSKIAIYDEKIKTAKENIDANRKALKQMDEAVDQVMGRSQDEKGADKAVALRRAQAKERTRLLSEIAAEQKTVTQLSEERAPIAAEVRKVEAEVGPIKYIASFIYGSNPDANLLEKAVTWVIIIIVIVFDPLAVILLLASQYSFQWFRKQQEEDQEHTPDPYVADVGEKPTEEEKNIESDTVPIEEEKSILEQHPYLTKGDFWKKPEGWVEVGPLVAQPEVAKQEEIVLVPPPDVDPIEQWNKMIEEAEKAIAEEKTEQVEPGAKKIVIEDGKEVHLIFNGQEWVRDIRFIQKANNIAQEDTVEERVARGESYIDTEGREQSLDVDLLKRANDRIKEQVNALEEESKKKNYMTKENGIQVVKTKE